MKNLFFLLALPLLLIWGCSSDDDGDYTIDDPVKVDKEELNIAYGTDPMQKMDIYFPEGFDENSSIIFLIHGGGFIAGDKEDVTNVAKLFVERGFVAVNLDHRLVDSTGLAATPPLHQASAIKVKDQVKDMGMAVDKFKSSADSLGVGTSKMYMAGHSAGGTLAMLYVQSSNNTDVRASGNFAGLTNVTLTEEMYATLPDHEYWPNVEELLYRMSGQEVTHDKALALMGISPNWVTENNKPGKPNITVMPKSNDEDLRFAPFFNSVEDAENYHKDLKSRDVESDYQLMDTDHGFGNHPDDWEKAVNYASEFFKKN